jgi:hypothetical protein
LGKGIDNYGHNTHYVRMTKRATNLTLSKTARKMAKRLCRHYKKIGLIPRGPKPNISRLAELLILEAHEKKLGANSADTRGGIQVNREFQVVYRADEGGKLGKIETVVLVGKNEDAIRDMLKSGLIQVLGVTLLRPVVDWDKPVWDRDEFAAAMNIKGGTLAQKMGDGKFPWNDTVSGVPSRVAMKWMEKGLNGPGMQILKELESNS